MLATALVLLSVRQQHLPLEQPLAAVSSATPEAQTLGAEPAPPLKAPHRILLEQGLLSIDVEHQRLGTVLLEISRKSGVPIFTAPGIEDQPVTLRLRGAPLDAGLRQLLKDSDVFFYSSNGALRTVWVYEKGGGSELIPVPPASWASTAELERKLTSPYAADRILAIEAIVARNGPGALETVTRLLGDVNAEVRLRALDVGLSAGVDLPRETLTALTSDDSPAVRGLALEAIVNGTEPNSPRAAETAQLVRRMLGDPDAEVRARAQELIDGAKSVP
jgi:hypothetical protein